MTDPVTTPTSESPAAGTPTSSPSSSTPVSPPTSTPPDDSAVAAAALIDLDPDVESGDFDDNLDFLSTTTSAEVGRPARKGPDGEDADDGVDLPASTQNGVPAGATQQPGAVAQPPAQVVTPPPAAVQPPVPPAAAAPAVVTPPAPAAAPAIPPAAAPTPAAQPVATAQPSAQDALAAYQTWRGNAVKTLAEKDFALSAKDVEDMEADPSLIVKRIPQAMAQVYMTTVENCTAAVQSMVPQLIENVLQQRQTFQKAEDAFFGKWPALKDHHDKVLEIGRSWRGLNKDASMDEFIANVGPLAHQMLGVAMAAAASAPKPQSLPPHTPAGGGMPRTGPLIKAPQNIFEEIALAEDPEEG